MDDVDLLSSEVSLCHPGTMGWGVVLLQDIAWVFLHEGCHMWLQDGSYIVGAVCVLTGWCPGMVLDVWEAF